jgi:hypothetical protein
VFEWSLILQPAGTISPCGEGVENEYVDCLLGLIVRDQG